MAYEQKDLNGSLFRNKRKEKDTHKDYEGTCRIDGHDYWISAWLKTSKDGEKFFSLAFKRKDGTAERPTHMAQEFKQEAARVFGLNDEVPF